MKLSLNTAGLSLQDLVFGASVYFLPSLKPFCWAFYLVDYPPPAAGLDVCRRDLASPANGPFLLCALRLSGAGFTDYLVMFIT